jgi:hypothetical protein
LDKRRNDPPDEAAKARRRAIRHRQKQRIAKRNEPLLKQINKQERTIERNMALIKRVNDRRR